MKKPKILSEKQIESALASLPGWRFRRNALEKTYEFADFRNALSFMVKAGFAAEELNHHPEWTNVYGRVHVRLSTHEAEKAENKVTARDVELAKQMERTASSFLG